MSTTTLADRLLKPLTESSGDSGYEMEPVTIGGYKFDVEGVTLWDTPDFISHTICLKRPEWELPLPIACRTKTLRWSEKNQCFSGGIESVRDLDSSDISDMLPVDAERVIKGLTIEKIQHMYKEEHGEPWDIQSELKLESLADRLLGKHS